MGQSSTKNLESKKIHRSENVIYADEGEREETLKHLRTLDPICCDTNSRSYTFIYNSKININSLKPFFDANVAVFVAECVKENNGIFSGFNKAEFYYDTKFEGLKQVIQQHKISKMEIIIYGDNEIIRRAMKIVHDSYDTNKQKLLTELDSVGK